MQELPLYSGAGFPASRIGHRAHLLVGDSYARGAVSDLGREVGREFLASGSERARSLLELLPSTLFRPYVSSLRSRLEWADTFWTQVMEAIALIETMVGCKHGCEMCYIDAPPPQRGGFLPWFHAEEVFAEIARERGRIIRQEMKEVFINDLLRDRLKPPVSVLDAAIAIVRHSRNRFANYSDHMMCYWRSNPTDWSDPLFGKDYADLCNALASAFQLFESQPFLALIEGDPLSQGRFRKEFSEDFGRLFFATSMHAVTSTVPFARGSLGERAISRLLQSSPHGSELVRVSIPHPNLIRSGQGNPERYWSAVQHSLRLAVPKMIYIFASTLQELFEVFERVSATFVRSELPWWIESRLGMFEILEGRKKGVPEEELVRRLRRVLKRLCFVGNLEGRGSQYAGSPLFAEKGTTMCVNGVVLAPDGKLHFQACTSPSGEDLATGLVIRDLDEMSEREAAGVISPYPLTNRARELATPNLDQVPLFERRKSRDWFQVTVLRNRNDVRYAEARVTAEKLEARLLPALRFW